MELQLCTTSVFFISAPSGQISYLGSPVPKLSLKWQLKCLPCPHSFDMLDQEKHLCICASRGRNKETDDSNFITFNHQHLNGKIALCMQPLCHEIHPQKNECALSPKESVERTAVFFVWLVVSSFFVFRMS